MKDFQIITAKTVLKIHSISPVRGFLPPAVVVLGEKMSLAKEAFYNGIQVKEMIVQSPTRLILRVPDSQVGKEINDVRVLSPAPLSRSDAVLSLQISPPFKTVEGLSRLIQTWVMIFLTTPGSDLFDPSSGGGGQAIIGRVTDEKGKGVAADLAQAIERTNNEILRLQAKNPRIPLSERLLSGTLESLQYDHDTSTMVARVSIKNMLGDESELDLR